jgi:hypothetical protein
MARSGPCWPCGTWDGIEDFVTGRSFRWDPYFMTKEPEFRGFWTDYLLSRPRNVLYVLGLGFDPRTCTGLKEIMEIGGDGLRNCTVIVIDEGPESASKRYESLVAENRACLVRLLANRGTLVEQQIEMWSNEQHGRRRIGSRRAAEVFTAWSDFSAYTDVLIDVSALPRSVFFSLLTKALVVFDQARRETPLGPLPNLHVVVAENVATDQLMRVEGIDEAASYVYGFRSEMEMETTAALPKLWLPVLGEGRREQLDRIFSHVNPEEICPILPGPSAKPRRGDDLLVELRELLFDRWNVEPRNIIYASERNPFDLYRQILRTSYRYNEALEPLGGCKVVVSALSSKMLSVGALLAAYELKQNGLSVGLAHVEALGYTFEPSPAGVSPVSDELFSLALAGESYLT